MIVSYFILGENGDIDSHFLVIYNDDMGKRDALYAGEDYASPYPSKEEQVHKQCDICNLDMIVNNWDDKKSRTPKIYDLVVCVDCDPRNIDDRYLRKGYRIMHRRRLRIVNMARIVRAVAKLPCLSGKGYAGGCKCSHCAAGRLFPPF